MIFADSARNMYYILPGEILEIDFQDLMAINFFISFFPTDLGYHTN